LKNAWPDREALGRHVLGRRRCGALLPSAQFRPPVVMGDVYRLVRPAAGRPPARIAIIDGLFEQVPAVWHKELLYAMERGVEVSGAASMGRCAPRS
jgi:hypothetical protein